MKLTDKQAWKLISDTVKSWNKDRAQSMGAALAFYTMFSIAPLLLIVVTVGGYFLGVRTMRGEIDSTLSGLVGESGAHSLEKLAKAANEASRRSVAAGVGVVIFLFGSTSVFNELQDALNRIWKTPGRAHPTSVLSILRGRLLSFAMIFGISVFLMVSLALATTVSVLAKSWGSTTATEQFVVHVLSSMLGYLLVTTTFAIIYKWVPRARIHFSDVWVGAALTAALFTIGNQLIGIYLRKSTLISTWGALSSIAVIILWVYYSAQIFLFGAEFTWIYSRAVRARRKVARP
ncbi:MAG TPA: YihY/virulence factor BrkB family protein [Opitutaceae bacterium]|jgi:membrane protein